MGLLLWLFSFILASCSGNPASSQPILTKPSPDYSYDRKEKTKMSSEKELMMEKNLSPVPQPVTQDDQRGQDASSTNQTNFNTEEYKRIYENPFLAVVKNPLSTFSIDVDTASYSNVRRFIEHGSLPPADAVRIEEFVNYFSYDYPEPIDKKPFSFNSELTRCPWNDKHHLLLIGLQAKKISFEKLPPNNLVFLLDVSGSMNDPDKLPLLKSALALLVNELRPMDRVAITVYAGAAGIVLPPTSGKDKQKILSALDNLSAGGSTAGGEGILLAYKLAKENFDPQGNNRVMLCTDGDFNVGPSSESALVRLIEEKRKEGVFLTVLGFGTGNLADARMESLADAGNGNYAYIDSVKEAKKALVEQMGGTLLTIAKDVKIQVEFNPAVVESYRLIGYENRLLRAEDFDDDKKDAGELGAGHSVTVLYELVIAGSNTTQGQNLRYQETDIKPEAFSGNELLFIKFRYKQPQADESLLITEPVPFKEVALAQASHNVRFAAAVAGFGLLLRDSEHKGDMTADKVLTLARGARGEDKLGYRQDFIQMAEQAKRLTK
jgi:Ca-activated chloride channel family protein